MTFDLATLDTSKVAEEGAELLVSHPTSGEDLGNCFAEKEIKRN